MDYRHGLFSVPSVLLFSFALGQSCDALLTHGLYNVSIATSERSYKAAEYGKICSSDYESSGEATQKQIQGGLSYAGFGASAASGKSESSWAEAQKEYCETNENNVEEDEGMRAESRQIYDRGIQAWERCVELSSRNVLIDFVVSESSANATTVTYGISYTGAGTSGIELTGIYIRPEDTFTCEGQVGKNKQNVQVDENTRRPITPQNLSITCERNATGQGANEGSTFYKQAAISIHTTDRNLDAFFPGIKVASSPKEQELEARIAALELPNPALELPVGTILSSILGPEQFLLLHGEDWILADGREVSSTAYAEITKSTNVPDLRGMFLRGINLDRNDEYADPDSSRSAGSLQDDELISHVHQYGWMEIGGDCSTDKCFEWGDGANRKYHNSESEAAGGLETRPTNVAVYYYIKVN